MSVINQNLLLTPEGYQISRSVRLRSSASAYFNRTPASAGNQQKFTYSLWVKRGLLTGTQSLLNVWSGSQYFDVRFDSGAQNFYVLGADSGGSLITNYGTSAVYRDPSAWYHLVVSVDTTQATSANRVVLYVNGTQPTQSGTLPSQNYSYILNSANLTVIGKRAIDSSQLFDGYLTEINFIDGQALTPASFGETDAVTGVWKPKKYAGTYGTNGFFLNFSDNSNNTATTIGKDSSGNGNNWTPNNISVTSGVTYDSMLDVPTMWADGGNGRGNYCVLNRLDADTSAVSTSITNGNLTASGTTYGATVYTCSMQIPQTGKWYWEVVYSTITNTIALGVRSNSTGSTDVQYYSNGNKNVGGTTTSYGSTWTTGDIIACAVDRDAGTVTWYKNNVSQGAINIPTNSAIFDIAFNVLSPYGSTTFNVNFGQRPFAYTPPTGFKALNTQNLPDSTIKKGKDYFNTVTYTGTGAAQSITGVGFQPDLLWIKSRSNAGDHGLVDSVRGRSKVIYSDLTDAEGTSSATEDVTALNADGFSLGTSARFTSNNNGWTFAAWNWKESVSSGFDIVTYTGTGSNTTVAHNLGVAPKMMIVKQRNSANSWIVYQASLGATQYLRLETTAAAAAATAIWNDTSPTSSVFTVGTSGTTNGSAQTYVAYLFAEVAGYSKFGSYTGNGSTDGPFVYLGFRPRFLMIKATSAAGYNWTIEDTARSTYNASDKLIFPSLSNAENTGTARNDFLSNGFKARDSSNNNVSGVTYIYAAFAENPFKNSLAR